MDIDPIWWNTASFEDRTLVTVLAERDISTVLRFLRTRGFSRARLAAVTGLSETRVRKIAQGRQRVTSYEVLDRIATGLKIPRHLLGLADPAIDIAADSGPANTDLSVTADPVVHDSWDDLLGVLAARSNVRGCGSLRQPAEGQIRLIAAARRAARGPDRRRLLAIEARWTEFLSWIRAHGRTPAPANSLLDTAYELSFEAQDWYLAAYILMRQSQQALDDGDGARAVTLARQARRTEHLPPRTSALALVREAEGHALGDDASACRERIKLALRLAATPPDASDHLGGHCTTDYVRACEARCRQLLGDSRAAVDSYEEVLDGWAQDARLDEGLWRADLASAYLDEGEPEQAAAETLSALHVASAMSSARAVRAVGALLPRLRRHRNLPAMPTLTDAYRSALAACHD